LTILALPANELHVVSDLYEIGAKATLLQDTLFITSAAFIQHRNVAGIGAALRRDTAKGFEIEAATDTKVAHCPSSNLFLRSGVMAYDRMRENEITVGLASDVAAGPELNPWEVMKTASYGQNVRSSYVRNAKTFSPAELFHLATVSSAAVLGKQSEIGQLRKGFMADCALWDTRDLLPYRSKLPHQPSELVSLLIYRGARLEATKAWVAGEVVWSEAKAGI
jgi:guanine deaminase